MAAVTTLDTLACLTHAPRSRHQRRGYILVVTLGVLVLAATLLVGIGRSSMRHAVDARAARDDLQRRWGEVSCRQAILPIAEQLLDAREQRDGKATPVLTTTLRLGGQTFELTIADEQAKADINAMLAEVEVQTVESRVRRALSGYGLADKVRLRPEVGTMVPGAAAAATTPPPIGSYGQVFDGISPDRWLRPPAGGGPAVADLMTCWGGGRINIRRASEPALRLAASPPLTTLEISRLIELRDKIFHGDGRSVSLMRSAATPPSAGRSPIRRLIDSAGLAQSSARIVSGFADGSTRHSIRILAGTGGRRWLSFAVLDTSDIQSPKWHVQSW
ncbi:hypothetical protein [Humisphaera borealis]|uniref:General secretion pathway protein GspK n=1 Tax=Humisphaera borealis TaxID=2807512 RepID=A0A7M2WZS3_9BACT|nr:hypothetical protein [Humisphaera borealis]QOV90975.1 hypothetical protein IPV69_06335 [Humisphaera borealis]